MEVVNICIILLAVFCTAGIGKSDTGPYIYYIDNIKDDMFRVAVLGGQPERMNISRTTPMAWPYAIAHNPVSDCLYWSEDENGKRGIGRYCLSNRSSSFLSLPGVDIWGIGVDARSGLLYVSDDINDRILSVNFENNSTWTVVSGGMTDPLGIAVDVAKGWLYWADRATGHVKKVRTDGSGRKALVTSGVKIPSGIALDEPNSRLYFCGHYSVQSIRDDGTDRRTHLDDTSYKFYDIAVDHRFIYVRGFHKGSAVDTIWRLAKDARHATGDQLLSLVTSGDISGIVLVGSPVPQSATTIPATTTTLATTTTSATAATPATTTNAPPSSAATAAVTHPAIDVTYVWTVLPSESGSSHSQDIQKYLLLIALPVVSVLLVVISLCFCFFCIKSGKCGKCPQGERNTMEGQQDANTHYELMPGIDMVI